MSLSFENDDDFTYNSYLKIGELLLLQQCVSVDEDTNGPEHDETLFIIIHQVYELWFKQLLHELDHIVRLLNNCLLYTSPSPRDATLSRMPSSA